ncbi:MAG: cysteine desulfurase [Bacteroidota bacterium]|nr:cysteine desulfurase [Bacteroidota bacterium]
MDIDAIRKRFPILNQQVNKRPLVYFDNGATTQKPIEVIDSLSNYYSEINSNVHRGVHHLSQLATEAYENSRKHIMTFINANSTKEIILTKGTTDSINLIASSFAKAFIKKGDEIIVSELEHHSNIVPWQLVCEQYEATLKVIPLNDDGSIRVSELDNLISSRTKIIAVSHVSNALGVINPVKETIELAHKNNIPVLIDGAQAIAHQKVDVQELDCDFYCFSAHKMYGPTGVGVLYGKEEWLEKLPPYQGGGEMIDKVSFSKTTYNELPYKFEAGTPNIAGVVAFEKAIDFIEELGIKNIQKHEDELLKYATEKLLAIDGLKIYGTAKNKAAVISFLLNDIHPYDLGTIVDKLGVAIRTGNHCAQPVMEHFNISGTMRASFSVYNTKQEIDILIEAINTAKMMLS